MVAVGFGVDFSDVEIDVREVDNPLPVGSRVAVGSGVAVSTVVGRTSVVAVAAVLTVDSVGVAVARVGGVAVALDTLSEPTCT